MNDVILVVLYAAGLVKTKCSEKGASLHSTFATLNAISKTTLFSLLGSFLLVISHSFRIFAVLI